MVILGFRPSLLLKKTLRGTLDDNILGLSAQTAYTLLFSLFPLLLFLAPLLSIIGDKQTMMNTLMAKFADTLPPKAYEMFAGVVKDERSWWKKKLIGLGMVVGAGILLGVVTAILLAGNDIIGAAQKHYVIGDTVATVWTYLQYPIAFVLLTLFLWAMYLILPAIEQSKKQALAGAVVAAVLFVVVTLAFRLYVQNFGSYNKTYGTIGGVIVLLTWMYLASVVVLVGGELNSEIHSGTGSTASRVGAIYNGRIATGENPGYPSTKSD